MRNSGFSWKTLRPGKRLVWLLALPVAGFIVLLMTVPLASRPKRTAAVLSPQIQEEISQDLNRDSDHDGLKDWEEKIYNTDPNNPDTDGDGTTDGEEIKAGRNPLVAGHQLADKSWSDALSISLPTEDNGNVTQDIATELATHSLTAIVADAVAKRPITDFKNSAELNSYIHSLTSETPLDKIPRPESREFVTSPDTSPEAVKKYFNAVAQIYLTNFSAIESDLTILDQFSKSGGDLNAFAKLDANIAAIEKALREIKATPVPYKWLGFAKDDVWYLSKTLAAVKILRNAANDPAAALLILKARLALLDDFGALYSDTKIKLAAAGVYFLPDEPAGQIIIRQ